MKRCKIEDESGKDEENVDNQIFEGSIHPLMIPCVCVD
jgi:hypothetical protein